MKSYTYKQKQDLTLLDVSILHYERDNVIPDFFKSASLKDPLLERKDILCEKEYFGICLIKPPDDMKHSIFGYSELIAGLALLGVIYAIADISYKFRLAVGWRFAFSVKAIVAAFAIIMLGTDIWFSKGWLLPNFLSSQALLQGLFGICFIMFFYKVHNIVSMPSRFSKKNSKIYFNELKKIIERGNEKELPFIADELFHSAESLIKLSNETSLKNDNKSEDILMLIADKKLCKHIITFAPDTAKNFFDTMSVQKIYPESIANFTKNISFEALMNEESRIYYEDSSSSGSLSIDKPFRNALYGNIDIIKALHPSPLSIPMVGDLKSKQLNMYTKVFLITIGSFLKQERDTSAVQVINEALEIIYYPCNFLDRFNNVDSGISSSDLYKQFCVSVSFVKKVVDYVSQIKTPCQDAESYLYKRLVNYMIKVIKATAKVQWSPNIIDDIHKMIENDFLYQIKDERAGKKIKKGIWENINKLLHAALIKEFLDPHRNIYNTTVSRLFFNIYGIRIYDYNNDKQQEFHEVLKNVISTNYLQLRRNSPDKANSLFVPNRSRYDKKKHRIIYINKFGAEDFLELKTE